MEPFSSTPAFFDLQLFGAMPGNSVLLYPDTPMFTIVAVTDDYCNISGKTKFELIGKGLFEVFPSPPYDTDHTSEKKLRASLEYAFFEKEIHRLPFHRYDIPNANGLFTERYWSAVNKPVLSETGEVRYIIHSAVEVTGQVVAEKRLKAVKGFEKAYAFFMEAPVIVGFVWGDDYTIELANEGLLEVWGRGPEVIGRSMFEAIPELSEQGFRAILDQVRITGKTFTANEYPITLNRHGKEEVLYFDFIYKPFYGDDKGNKASGVISIGHNVTTQVQAKRKIEESEAKYRTLFETMDQGFCVLEMIFDSTNKPIDCYFLEINPVFEQQTGLQQATGKTIKELVPNLESHWLERYGKVALTGEPARFIEGSVAMGKWFDVYAFRIGQADDKRIALLFSDITERRKAEEAIKQSENKLRNIIRQSPVAMCILSGPSFIVEVANERIMELWGKRSEEVLGKPVFDVLDKAGELGLLQEMQKVYSKGERFVANEMQVPLSREGKIETAYINFVYEPFKGADGTIEAVLAVAIDVTDEVVARKAVEESHKEFQFVMDFMPQMIWITRPDGYHYYYNKQWYDYTGLTYGETEGDGWNEVFHPDDQKRA